MAEQLVSKLKFKDSEYIIKDAWAREELNKCLWSRIIDLSNPDTIELIQGDEIIWDAAVNAFKCKGDITISVPHLGTYQVELTTLTTGTIITTANENYAVGEKVIFLQKDVNNIAFTANDYIHIKLIKINETIFTIPTKVSQLKNDAEYIDGKVEDELLIFNVNFND